MSTLAHRRAGLAGVVCGLCVAVAAVAYPSVAHSDSGPAGAAPMRGAPVTDAGDTNESEPADATALGFVSELTTQLPFWGGSPGLVAERDEQPPQRKREAKGGGAELLGTIPLGGGTSGGAPGDIAEPNTDSPLEVPKVPADGGAKPAGTRSV